MERRNNDIYISNIRSNSNKNTKIFYSIIVYYKLRCLVYTTYGVRIIVSVYIQPPIAVYKSNRCARLLIVSEYRSVLTCGYMCPYRRMTFNSYSTSNLV